MQITELADYIGNLLEISRFKDYCPNGLQIEGRTEVRRIATGVSASQQVIESATAWGADAILVHHGYFWRNEAPSITGIKKRRIAHLLAHDVNLLAYHLPLDAHAELGNNAQLARRLGWNVLGRFAEQDIGWHGELPQATTLDKLAERIAGEFGRTPLVIGNRQRELKRIAWCSGGAQGYFEAAIALGVDAFLTGEISEQNVHVSHETGVAFISAGHHATERYGVQALGAHLSMKWGLEHRFFDAENPV